MYNCTAVVGSLTIAMKAQKALSAAAIPATVVKLDSSVTKRGCAYGLEYSCNQDGNVHAVMNSSGIKVARYVNGGGSM